MTYEDYLSHYFNTRDMILFLLIALAGAFVFMLLLVLVGRLTSVGNTAYKRKLDTYYHTYNLVQRFYEMVFSASSILSFLALYYLVDRFVLFDEFRIFWDKYSDFILLVMIVLSIVVNNYLDHLLIPLKKIDSEEKASVRVSGMLYVFFIFFYIKFIYENNNYDGFIMYFLGLMIGRFVYFDASFKDFLKTIGNALKNLPLLILGLAYTGLMCYYGFSSDYLLKSNGVLVSTFFAHIYMIVAIFIIHHSHIIKLFVKKPEKSKKYSHSDNYEEDEDYEYDYDDEHDGYVSSYESDYPDDYEEYDNYDDYYEDDYRE